MVNGEFNLRAAAGDLALQRGDPRLELDHRKAIEILPQQGGQGIVGPGTEDIFEVHKPHR